MSNRAVLERALALAREQVAVLQAALDEAPDPVEGGASRDDAVVSAPEPNWTTLDRAAARSRLHRDTMRDRIVRHGLGLIQARDDPFADPALLYGSD